MPDNRGRSVVLLVEDEGIIGITLEDELADAGYDVAGAFATCASALAWLEGATPDLAILDVTLRDGTCTELARRLRDSGVPFVVYSGSSQSVAAPEFQDVPWIGKPSPFGDLLAALRSIAHPEHLLNATPSP